MMYCMVVHNDRASGWICNNYVDASGTVGGNNVCTQYLYRGDVNYPPKVDVTSKKVVNKVANNPHPEGTAGRGVIDYLF